MNMEQIIVDYATVEVEDFVKWVSKSDPQLVEKFLGTGDFYKTTDVEKLFDALDDKKKQDYQYIADNKNNLVVANHLGLLEPSASMSSGEPGDLLKSLIKVLVDASIKVIHNPKIVLEMTMFNEKFVSEPQGGTDMSAALDAALKEHALKNIGKMRSVIYFTDGEPTKEPKPKK